jgi:site-specific recombinase XerD
MTAKPQLPAVLDSGALAPGFATDTYIVPSLIADVGEPAAWRYVEFFAANLRNPNTRRAYLRACGRFFGWCEHRGLALTAIRPFDVAAWVEQLQAQHEAPSVKQQLAAVCMLFDWLITSQMLPMTPAVAVRGPTHVVKTGKAPVLDAGEWRKLIDSIPTDTVRDLRDRGADRHPLPIPSLASPRPCE